VKRVISIFAPPRDYVSSSILYIYFNVSYVAVFEFYSSFKGLDTLLVKHLRVSDMDMQSELKYSAS